MIRPPLAACAFLVLAAAPASSGEGGTMVGHAAPEIQVTAWIHGDGRNKLSEFRGEAVLLEFWESHCPMCRGQVAHMNKLHETYADRGLDVIGITSEDVPTNLRWLAHAAETAPAYAIAVGGASGYSVTGVPHAFLVGPDGTIVWEGPPGSLPEKDVLVPMLNSLRTHAKEIAEARAAARLALAESLAADRQFARAEAEFAQAQKLAGSGETAKKAALRAKEMSSGENAVEFEAQKQIAKLLGGFEHPPERLKAKDADALAKRLIKMSEELKAKTPRAAQMAADWAAILSQPWK